MSMSHDSLEDRLKQKLKSGEISKEEYDELFVKFNNLGMLSESPTTEPGSKIKNLIITGTRTIDGGSFGQIISTGKLIADGNLECQRLSISGSVDVDGELTVIGNSSVNGELLTSGVVKFGGPLSSTGSLNIGGGLFCTSKCSSSGEMIVEGTFTSDHPLSFNGRMSVENIMSSSTIRLAGEISIFGSVVGEMIELSKGAISIGGDVKGKRIYIADPFKSLKLTVTQELENIGADLGKQSINDIGEIAVTATKFASNLIPGIGSVVSSISDLIGGKPTDEIDIQGNIEGNEVVIANTIVHGDVIADTITIGNNVVVKGSVKYRNSINKTEYQGIKIVKID